MSVCYGMAHLYLPISTIQGVFRGAEGWVVPADDSTAARTSKPSPSKGSDAGPPSSTAANSAMGRGRDPCLTRKEGIAGK